GRRRSTQALPWDAAVYPPLVTVRLRASVAEAARRHQGVTPIRQLGEGRLFESLREWVPGDDLRHIDWKATAKRRKVITRQYEAERRQQVLLVLDTGRLLTAEIAGVSRLDYVVQAANVGGLRPRHLPLAVTLRNPELDGVAALRPEATRDAFRKAAAEELLHAREEALSRMRRGGVLVLDVPPARAAQAVVAKYLEL